jgi:tryptophan halogenase
MKYVIVGGGAAGWITALFMQDAYPESDITLIENSKIGILGAGESTLSAFVGFLRRVNIPIKEIIAATSATVKIGSKFVGWTKGGEYTLPFDVSPNKQKGPPNARFSNDFYDMFNVIDGVADKSSIMSMIQNNDVPFDSNLTQQSAFALNLDAGLLAKFLSKKAQERGVKIIDTLVQDFIADADGNITSIVTEQGNVDCDFIFDCSGFARLVIGNFYKAKWQSYTDILPVDAALPFFLPRKGEQTVSYLTATAANAGWMWRIPLQHRYGCGYTFDSSFISFEEAEREVRAIHGDEAFIPKAFNYKAGCYETPWIKNCVAIGVSSGFLEPLEASSMFAIINMMEFSLNNKLFENYSNLDRRIFNDHFMKFNRLNIDFIYLHYMGDLDHTPFWKTFKDRTKMPERVKLIMEYSQHKIMTEKLYSELMEPMGSSLYAYKIWFHVLHGLNLISPKAKEHFKQRKLPPMPYSVQGINHDTFLELCKQS